ncbi:hypothetical protein DTO271G3_1648 [Paecilomyces variotii]|nr:hypothetical protein DTO271G3_1648 [Paecilomyces variotii]
MASSTFSGPVTRRTGRISYESDSTVRKSGSTFKIKREIETIAFIRRHTTIPTPEILNYQINSNNSSWFLMTRLRGTTLSSAWPNMNDHARTNTLSQLKSYLSQLRNLHPSSTQAQIGSYSGESAYDHRLNNGFPIGPFDSVSEFHDFLVSSVKRCPRPELYLKYRQQFSDDFGVHFAHADFSYDNIMVDEESGDVTGMIDWEMAGFWPEWWEYRKALFGGRCQRWWVDVVDQVMPSYWKEFEIDSEIEMF